MKIGMQTKVHIVSKKDGHLSESTLNEWHLSLVGGSRWDEYEVFLDRQEAKDTAEKYKLIRHLSELLGSLDPIAAIPATKELIADLTKSMKSV